MSRIHVSSGSAWEESVAYSRALRVGQHIFVAGTTAVDEQGRVIGIGDPYAQTVAALGRIERALGEAGASLRDVVQTRLFTTDISRWEEIGRAHGEFFAEVRPVTSMLQVARLIEPELLVEIEAVAVIDS